MTAPAGTGRVAAAPGGPGWAAHLRAGGTTPWLAWREQHGPAAGAESGPGLPGAQQLELLRRLNAAGRPSQRLVERVLSAGGTGRGRLDLALVGDGPERAYGAPPVDPAVLPAGELLRVAVGLVADDVVAGRLGGDPASGAPATGPARYLPWRRLPWQQRHRIVGDPRLAGHLRREARRRRRVLGDPPDRVLVLGAGLEQALVDVWCARFVERAAPPWEAWLRTWVERDRTPPRADIAALAGRWVERSGPEQVHVVLEDALADGAGAELLRVRRLAPPPLPPGAGAAELTRRVAAVLGVLVPPAEQRRLAGGLLTRLGRLGVPGVDHPPAVPGWAEPWLQRRALAQREDLAEGGYRVHGDPATVLTRTGGGTAGPAPALAVAVAALLAADGPVPDGAGRAGAGRDAAGRDGAEVRG